MDPYVLVIHLFSIMFVMFLVSIPVIAIIKMLGWYTRVTRKTIARARR